MGSPPFSIWDISKTFLKCHKNISLGLGNGFNWVYCVEIMMEKQFLSG
jgi:hypothetical protein